ncbi:uncharacterized protein Z520_11635 [Fonsecaea multimorphosa CBS 102226]|uniref:DUF1996 domain-containing protein n=1 Tax=Fonsecaea multimorphosa CBS 102226 TaxID=1442371 RepID=A0A0D2I5Q7_9EURO|nr:uncharacterized protein Z520_11635 [Fonsecaea multimorphosa CBS 102226]KIX92606.1 hypothetical protein Z520_11635 [Fonsecaea multimorphosa CBS 102226]OAL17910.1 hypothetical protein AYO22_11174 [Fonsecaea multimorphosa]
MKSLDLSQSLWSLALLPSLSHAYWRMACSVSQTARVDLILNPGEVSGHVHKFAGGSNVNQYSDFNSLQTSNCSTCEVQQDKSAYWTPQLYYAHANGSFEEVPNYGMTVYYVGRGGNSSNTVPFPAGFKMITGDTRQRSYDNTTLTYLNTRPVADRVSFHCIDEANDIPEQHYMFRTDCVNGMRAQVNFQSCWDGVNLYLDNNAHVDYLSGIDYGVCPPSHPVPIPGLFFEVLYMTNSVDQSAGGQFVFSNGDTTGYGFHGDFLNGWDMDIQTAAVQDCLYTDNGGVVSACSHLSPSDDTNFPRDCLEQPSVFDEPVHGMLSALPGCNPITSGPAMADSVVCPLDSHTLDAANQTSILNATSTAVFNATSTAFSNATSSAIASSLDAAATSTETESTVPVTTDTFTTPSPTPIDAVASSVSSSIELSSSDLPPMPATVTSFDQFTSTMESGSGLVTTTVTEWVTITVTGPNDIPANFVAVSSTSGVASTPTATDSSMEAVASSESIIYTDSSPKQDTSPTTEGMTTITLYATVAPTNTPPAFSQFVSSSDTTSMTIGIPTPTNTPSAFSQFITSPNTTLTAIYTPSPTHTPSAFSQFVSANTTLTIPGTPFPTNTSPAFSEFVPYPNTTFTTVVTPAATNTSGSGSIAISTTVAVAYGFPCSLYADFTIEGCQPPAATSSTVDATTTNVPSAFVTATQSVADNSTVVLTTSAPAATPFRIRGREVFLTEKIE